MILSEWNYLFTIITLAPPVLVLIFVSLYALFLTPISRFSATFTVIGMFYFCFQIGWAILCSIPYTLGLLAILIL